MNNLYILLLFITISSFSQEPTYRHYDINDGLPSNEVYYIFQDSKGYMWFATDNGVSRFNGYEFKNYSVNEGLPDNTIFEIAEDNQGRIWFISMSSKLSYFFNDSVYHYKYNKVISDNLTERYVSPIVNTFYIDENNNIELGLYGNGMFHISNKGLLRKSHLNEKEGYSFVEDSKRAFNKYYTFGLTYGTMYTDTNKFLPAFYFNTNNKYIITNLKTEDCYGHSHCVNINKGLLYTKGKMLLHIKDSILYNIKKFPSAIISIFLDKNNYLWISFLNGGLQVYKNIESLITPDMSLYNNEIISNVFEDKDKGLWVSSLTKGVYYESSYIINSYSNLEKLGFVKNLILSGDSLWMVNDNAISVLYNSKVSCINIEGIDKSKKILAFKKKGGKLIIVTKYEVYIYDILKEQIIKEILKDELTQKNLILDKEENIWFVGTEGIVKYNKKFNEIYNSRKENISRQRTDACFIDNQNNLWLGGIKGLTKFRNNFYEHQGYVSDLLSQRIINIVGDGQEMFLATKGFGLIVKNADTIYSITTKEGLLSNTISSMYFKNNILWVGTSQGLNKIEFSDEAYEITPFNHKKGLLSNAINSITSIDSILYIGADNGLYFFNYEKSNQLQSKNLPVIIDNVIVNGYIYKDVKSLTLENFENNISINFYAISYACNGNIDYKYKLKGADETWRLTNHTSIEYPYLAPNKYEFQIIAQDENGIWSEGISSFKLEIKQVFWRTWWFMVLVSLGFLIIIFIIQYRIQNIRLNELKKRNEIIASLYNYKQQALSKHINPHFIFNSLNSIQNYILKNDRVLSSEYLNKFSSLIRKILVNSQSSTILIKDEVESLELYLEIESNRFKKKFSYMISVSHEGIYNYKIPPLLIQPFAENAIWHGLMHMKDKGCIKIILEEKDNFIYCSIDDNGIGREKANEFTNKKRKSFGTSITEKRLETINLLHNSEMSIEYIDKKENNQALGTTVIMRFPIIE